MRAGTENRKKTILAGALGAVALVCIFSIYSSLFGGPSTPAARPAPAVTTAPTVRDNAAGNARSSGGPGTVTGSNAVARLGVAPGVPATRLASTSSSLDPTLDEAAMLRTETLTYSGSGRNIFSATYVAPAPVVPRNVPSARPRPGRTLPPPPPPPPATCPPSCPPVNLKFFGTARRRNGVLQGFFLGGEDVYLANQGDIIARKYRIVSLSNSSARVEDLQNNNTQTLPLQTH